MPERYYVVELEDGAVIHVFFETARGRLVQFVVKLVIRTEGIYREVVRFDSAHDCPHKDILDVDGRVRRKVWFESLDNKQGLDLAVRDLRTNYKLYIERYKKWQKKQN
jgi:hypothetical protein